MPDEAVLTSDKEIDERTHWARRRGVEARKSLARMSLDPDKVQRHKRHECPTCYYLGSGTTAGQAFTGYTCKLCKFGDFYHNNTNVPKYCPHCCDKLSMCGRCGADIDLRERQTDAAKQDKLSAVDRLCDVMTVAGAFVTYDPERDTKLPCFGCGEDTGPRQLVDMRFRGGRLVTRPFCDGCIKAKAHRKVKEREVDARTIHRLKGIVGKLYDRLQGKSE